MINRRNTRVPEETTILRGILTWYAGIYLSEKSNYQYWIDREKQGRLAEGQLKSKQARYYGMKFSYIFFFIFGPVYLFSRLINFLFPFIILIYVYSNSLWDKIDLFQWSMMCTYSFCVIIVLILLVIVLYHQYHFFHIVGSVEDIPRFDWSRKGPRDNRSDIVQSIWHLTRNSYDV